MKLIPHPAHPPKAIESVEVEFWMTDGDEILLRYLVRGSGLLLPDWRTPGRAGELWMTTCFEIFVMPDDGGDTYFEFNFSPSTRWAAYAFNGYRAGMRDLAVAVEPHIEREPELEPEDGEPHYALEADLDFSEIPPGALKVGLTAVIEEKDGTKSYWALAHVAEAPDFHRPESFTLELPPAA